MNLKLNGELNDIFSYTREEAMRLGNNTITTDHFFLGIIRHLENSACKCLESLGVDIAEFKSAIEKFLNTGTLLPIDMADTLHLSKAAENATKLMYLEARSLKDITPTTEHLMLALLRSDEGHAIEYLKEKEIDYKVVRNSILGSRGIMVQPQPSANIKVTIGDANQENSTVGTPLLQAYGYDLTKAAEDGNLDPVVGREPEIEHLAQILVRRKKNNPVLIGEAGAGKSAIVEGLASKIAKRDIYPGLIDKRIVALDMASIVAGTKYRGQFEERIKGILGELKRHKEIILFIDEIHTIVGAGSAPGSLDAANMLKPPLARGLIQCIGATTMDEYREVIEKDRALERRFQKVVVDATDFKQTLDILKNIKGIYERHHNVTFSDEALEACVRLSMRYIPDRVLPDKAIDIMDETGARLSLRSAAMPKEILDLESEIASIAKHKREAVAVSDFEIAANLRDVEREKSAQLNTMKKQWQEDKSHIKAMVSANDVALTISAMVKIPANKVSEEEGEKLLQMGDALRKEIIGQDEAVESVVRAIRRNRAGIKNPGKPIGTFLFLGPTGVGKTHLAKLVAKYLFDSEDNMVRIDMSEYMEKYAVSRLIGAPPGYVGYNEGGQLTEAVRRKPYCVVLLDEVEKAHPDLFNIMLQVFDEGRLTDSNGRHVDFKNTVIIMTSNLGSRDIREFGAGVGFAATSGLEDEMARNRSLIDKAIQRSFTPELLNRIDEQVIFSPLDKKSICKIVDLELQALTERMAESAIRIEFDKRVRNFIFENGYDAQYGARPLKRAIQKYIENPLADVILTQKLESDDSLLVKLNRKGTEISIIVKKGVDSGLL